MMRAIAIPCLCLLPLAACTKSGQSPPAAPVQAQAKPPVPQTAPGHFGAPLSQSEPVAAAAVIGDPAKYNGQTLKIAGQVGGVCQKKGCWMTLSSGEPGGRSVRVTFKDYAFFVPRDSLGKQAVAEGRFEVATLSQAEAQHYADDEAKAGAPARRVESPQENLSLVATGVELR